VSSVRILGPIELADAPALGGRRQVALLAYLVLHANQAVSTDQLIEALWVDRPREGAVKRLQVAVTRLRKILGRTPLRTVGGGYLLTIQAGELDADVFRARLREGRGLMDTARPREAAIVLGDALTMWRGPPLVDVAFESFAQPEIRRLEELRAQTVELILDAALAVGRHVEVLAELEALVVAEPLREHPRAQLMLALYRSGRQSEALAAFHDGRRALLEAIGVEPGPALQRMNEAVLRQDAALMGDDVLGT
jgi:DNA-binding SARP family transcriptional activator